MPTFHEKVAKFSWKILQCSSRDRQIFLQKWSNFPAKIIKFSWKIVKFFGKIVTFFYHATLRRTFGKYLTVIPTREEWDKDWPNWLRKEQVWFTDRACNQQGTPPLSGRRPMWRSLARRCSVCGANLACVHRYTSMSVGWCCVVLHA